MNTIKICPCGKEVVVTNQSRVNRTKYCSKKCFYRYRSRPSGLTYVLQKVNPTSFKKGQKPWNTGKPMSEEMKTALSEANKGKHFGLATEFKKGNVSWNHGKKIWPGNESDYNRLHRWVRKILGEPKLCVHCGVTKQLVWANRSQKYYQKENDWLSLCRSCHMKMDYKFIKQIK